MFSGETPKRSNQRANSPRENSAKMDDNMGKFSSHTATASCPLVVKMPVAETQAVDLASALALSRAAAS